MKLKVKVLKVEICMELAILKYFLKFYSLWVK